jgi:hypothetical protein
MNLNNVNPSNPNNQPNVNEQLKKIKDDQLPLKNIVKDKLLEVYNADQTPNKPIFKRWVQELHPSVLQNIVDSVLQLPSAPIPSFLQSSPSTTSDNQSSKNLKAEEGTSPNSISEDTEIPDDLPPLEEYKDEEQKP